MKICEAVQTYFDLTVHHSKATGHAYSYALDKLIDHCGELDIKDYDALSLADFNHELIRLNTHPNTHNYIITVVKVFLHQAKQYGWCDHNYSSVKPPRKVLPDREIIESDEIIYMLNRAKTERDQLILMILWDTGIRVAELCDITLSDINLEERQITIGRRKSYNREKVYLSEMTTIFLDDYLLDHGYEHLLISKQKKPLGVRSIEIIVKYCADGLNKKITPHTFRHTLAWRILEGGGELIDVQNALGHTNPVSSQKNYMNWSQDRARLRISRQLGYDKENARITRKERPKRKDVKTLQSVG